MKAIWNNQILAESDETVVVDGNHYFPNEAVKSEFFADSQTHTHCPYKGEASYYHVEAGGQTNKDAAWYYPEPISGMEKIKNHVAFWKGVKVSK